ncbi:Trigger factor [uncultured Gammaproteobacteria bacterium]
MQVVGVRVPSPAPRLPSVSRIRLQDRPIAGLRLAHFRGAPPPTRVLCSMEVTETSVDGLKREFRIVVPASDLDAKIETRLNELCRTVRMPGFRPGKVPVGIVRQRHSQAVMQESVEEAVNQSWRKLLTERGLRLAFEPKLDVEQIYAAGTDLIFRMTVEILPEIEPIDLASLELERPVAEVDDAAVEDRVQKLAASVRGSDVLGEDRGAAEGDIVVIDIAGSCDGAELPEFPNTKGYPLELGSKALGSDFDEQLVGARPGEHLHVTVDFPADHPNEKVRGRKVPFHVDVKELRAPVPVPIDDELAKRFGMADLVAFRDKIRQMVKNEYAGLSRRRLKRQLLDKLAESHDFPVPVGLVDAEFESIWQELEHQRAHGHLDPSDAARSDDEIKAEYHGIAERRVRLGLLLAEIGRRNNLKVEKEELNRAAVAEARRYPGQEMKVLEWFKANPTALERLKAPIYEDKVVDFVLELAKITDRTVPAGELTKEDDSDD